METMAKVRKTKTFKGTWLGQAGESETHHLDSRSTGLRVVVHRWTEDGKQGKAGETTVRRVKGDGWRDPDNFVEEYNSGVLTSDAEVADALSKALS